MFFAIMKLSFELDYQPGSSSVITKKDLTQLVEKIRSKHRVAAMVYQSPEAHGSASIGIASLAQSEESLSRQLDAICLLCEEYGLGRIDNETTLMDHIDSISDFAKADN